MANRTSVNATMTKICSDSTDGGITADALIDAGLDGIEARYTYDKTTYQGSRSPEEIEAEVRELVADLPGATLGVLGGGQLGRMFTLAARRMGYRITVFAPDDDTPAGQIAYREIRAPYEDLDAVRRFAAEVAVVSFEFENVPAATGPVSA